MDQNQEEKVNDIIDDPFTHKIEVKDPIEKLKIIIFGIFIIPIRLFFVLTFFTMMYIFVRIIGFRLEHECVEPLTGWRRICRNISSILFRSTFFAGSIQHVKVIGKCATREEAPIRLIAPHTSFTDTIFCTMHGTTSCITIEEMKSRPIIKDMFKSIQSIYWSKNKSADKSDAVTDLVNRVRSKDQNWVQLLIFPEGTCTNGKCLVKFQLGAFYAGVPVQPVCVSYPNKYDKTTWTCDKYGALKRLFILLAQFNTKCQVEYLPVYVPSEEEKANPELYANNVQKLMAKKLNLPATNWTLHDFRLIKRAKLISLPFANDILEIKKLRKAICLDKSKIEVELVKSTIPNLVNFSEFAKLLQINADEVTVKRLFDIFNVTKKEQIDFRNYLVCSAFLINESLPFNELLATVVLIYKNFDMPGKFTSEQFHQMINLILSMSADKPELALKQINQIVQGVLPFDDSSQHNKQQQNGNNSIKKDL